jgi:hypothetical protein
MGPGPDLSNIQSAVWFSSSVFDACYLQFIVELVPAEMARHTGPKSLSGRIISTRVLKAQ